MVISGLHEFPVAEGLRLSLCFLLPRSSPPSWAQVPRGYAETPEDVQDGAGRQPGSVGPGRLSVSAFHLGQLAADRY